MKFDFNFATLLEHRQQLEDVARREWTEAQHILDQAMEELNEMYRQVHSSRERISQIEKAGGPQVNSLVAIGEFINGQKTRIEKQRFKIRGLMANAEEKQELLIEAAKERRTLEKLKEKRFEEFKKAVRKHDAKILDDLVVTRFGRGGNFNIK